MAQIIEHGQVVMDVTVPIEGNEKNEFPSAIVWLKVKKRKKNVKEKYKKKNQTVQFSFCSLFFLLIRSAKRFNNIKKK